MRYLIFWRTGTHQIVSGDSIIEACINAGIGKLVHNIYAYAKEEDVAGNAGCGCVHHAEEKIACEHDIRTFWREGIRSPDFGEQWPQLTVTEIAEIIVSC